MSAARYAVGLDIGSTRTRCVVCVYEDEMLRFLGHGDVPSTGWAKGRVADAVSVAESIRQAVSAAERASGVQVEGAVLGIGGMGIEGANSRGLYEFGRPREIDPGDLTYAIELASKMRLNEDRLIIQVTPQDFTVDGRAKLRNPRGLMCSRLEAHVYVISGATQEHQTLVNAAHQAALAVEETIFEPTAAAYACLDGDERKRGVAIVDIGGQSTDVVIYEGDAIVSATSIPIAADHLTRDVAYGLTVSFEDAESLKREYGCAILGLTSDNSLIEVPSPEGRPAREASRRLLNEILEARAEELFLYVRNELARANLDGQLLEGLVLTGAGAKLNGMCDIAEKVVNCPARIGLPSGIAGWPEEMTDAAWCAAAGLAMYSAKLKTRREWKKTVPGLMNLVLR